LRGGCRSISPRRAEAFLRDGYAVLDRFIDDAEVAVLRTDVERLLRSPQGESCERPHNTLVPLRWDHTIVEQILASETRANRLSEVLGGGDPRWISGYLSLKEPHSPALWWHQDWWCWDHPVSYQPQAPQVALLCYLTATDERNAALRLLPGSHHTSTSLHPLLPEAHTHETGDLPATHPAMSDHPSQVTPRLNAGDAVVIDYRLLHGTHANTTAVRRDCVLLTFAPSWRTLPADIRGHLIRHPALPTDGQTPAEAPWAERLLPSYDGPQRDLPLNRAAPRAFAITGGA
jgi:ectoine hydroxylase-related dioxygenase (phytanoyl-CoA dioxygenase family)